MSPLFSAIRTPRILFGCWLSLFAFNACDLYRSSPSGGGAEDEAANDLNIQVYAATLEGGLAASLDCDSLVFAISGPEIPITKRKFAKALPSLILPDMPPGKNRLVLCQAYRKQRVLYEGRMQIDIDPAKRNEASLVLKPQFARLRAQILLSTLEYPVVMGTMKVKPPQLPEAYAGTWKRQGSMATVLADTLPQGDDYSVDIQLSDSTGAIRYTGVQTGISLEPGVESTLQLTLIPTSVSTQVSLSVSRPTEMRLDLAVPAGRRSPRRAGELQITEAYPIPSVLDSGSEGEWMEIFNASPDTLILTKCRISRDLQGGTTRSYPLDSLGGLAPGQVVSLGRAGSPARVKLESFSLVNTQATLWLTCNNDSLVLDTLKYSGSGQASDAVSVKEGQVLQRKPSSLGMVGKSEDWCLALNGNREASPGRIFPACGEE